MVRKLIRELKKSDYEKVIPLFQPIIEFQPLCAAVLAGIQPGRVFVDDPTQPQSAFMNVWKTWCFLVGNPANHEFNRELNKALFEKEVVEQGVVSLLFTCHPQNWGGKLQEVFSPRIPVTLPRRHYVCRHLKYDWLANLLQGYAIHPMEADLLTQSGLIFPDQVKETLEKWNGISHPEFRDFGFVAVHEGQVVSWATLDGIINGTGDIGLETLPEYRQKGLAAAVTAATIEHAFSLGLTEVHWTNAETNIGSILTAEKLGFDRRDDYIIYLLSFDEAHNLTMIAYNHLQNKQYDKAREHYERYAKMSEEPPAWFYLDMAQVHAGLKDFEKAFEYLISLVEKGWKDKETLAQIEEFKVLHKKNEWVTLLDKIN